MRPGRIVVTGSVAYDYLMTFPGKFLESSSPTECTGSPSRSSSTRCAVSGRRGAQHRLQPRPPRREALILAAAGPDAADYRDWLAGFGVDVSGFVLFEDVFTASFFVSTDQDQNQLATFYAGRWREPGS